MTQADEIEVHKFLSANLHFVVTPPSGGAKKHTVRLEVIPNKDDNKIQGDLILGGTQWVVKERFKHLTPSEALDVSSDWFGRNLRKALHYAGVTQKDLMYV